MGRAKTGLFWRGLFPRFGVKKTPFFALPPSLKISKKSRTQRRFFGHFLRPRPNEVFGPKKRLSFSKNRAQNAIFSKNFQKFKPTGRSRHDSGSGSKIVLGPEFTQKVEIRAFSTRYGKTTFFSAPGFHRTYWSSF